MEKFNVGDTVIAEVSFIRAEVIAVTDNTIELKWPSGYTMVIPVTDNAYRKYVTVPKGFKPVITFIRE